MSHANAALTPRARLRLALLIVEEGWPVARAAERYDVSWPTAKRWAERYRELGPDGMGDRASRPIVIARGCLATRRHAWERGRLAQCHKDFVRGFGVSFENIRILGGTYDFDSGRTDSDLVPDGECSASGAVRSGRNEVAESGRRN